MTKSKKLIGGIMLALCAVCVILNINVGATHYELTHMPKLLACTALLACVSALYYAFRGFKKYAAPAFTAYMLICGTFCIFCTVAMANQFGGTDFKTIGAFLVVENSLLSSFFFVLSLSKNVGKKYSVICSALILAIVLLQLIGVIVSFAQGNMDHVSYGITIARIVTKISFSLIAVLMVQAKYIDKAERGSK